MAIANKNMVQSALPASIPYDEHRSYIRVSATTGAVTVDLDNGGNPFTITGAAGSDVWEPHIAPQNAITFTGTGVLVLG